MTPSRRAAETAWKAGDKLTWSGERWTFWQFDPDYPRAICQSDALRVCAIDITTAKRVDPATERKRAERRRRKEAGEVRFELWLTPQHQSDLSAIMDSMGLNQAEAICWAIGKAVGR